MGYHGNTDHRVRCVPNILHMENVWILILGGNMKRDYYEMQWPRDNIYLTCYTHEILNYRYHWHQTEFELDILLSGSQEFCRGNEIFLMKEDDVVLTGPGTGHASLAQEENTNALVLRFSQAIFKPYLKKGYRFIFPQCLSVGDKRDHPGYPFLRFYAAQILDAAVTGGPYGPLTAKASLELLVSTLCRMFEPQMVPIQQSQGEQQQEIIGRLILYMEEHYKEKITLEDLAEHFQYNRTYISTLFKHTTGINFYEYLVRIRFQQAVAELAVTDKNLTEIAVGSGFPDLKTFNRRFRDTFGRSPAEYRARLKTANMEVEGKDWHLLPMQHPIVREKLQEYMRPPG